MYIHMQLIMYNIAVIGSGVIGLTSAIQIQKDIKSAKVTIFTDKLSPETTGDMSAGFWTPYLLGGTSEDDITRWSKATHDYFHQLWKEGVAQQTGICLQPAMRLFKDDYDNKIPKWIHIPYGSCYLSSNEVQKINRNYSKDYSTISLYVTFTCEPTKLLPFLMQEFIENGGNLIKTRVNHFSDISEGFNVIVNCAGLESRNLAQDPDVYAIRGQVSRVQAPWQFQIVMDESSDINYIIPNSDCVILGGTHQICNENLSVSLLDKTHILEGCAKIAPGLKNCEKYEDDVGLRPGRNQVRLNMEKLILNGKSMDIVHNYGHGGAGVTLSVGCAQDACDLVKSALGICKSHL